MDRRLVFVFVTLTTPLLVYGAAFYALGKCPDGHHPGEMFPYHNNHCSRCFCDDLGYNCVTCGVMAMDVQDGCYTEGHPEEDYPKCCNVNQVCMGQPNFNQTKYDDYRNGLLG